MKPSPHKRSSPARSGPRETRLRLWPAAVALAGATFLVFARTLGHPFVNYDDQLYVFRNPWVLGGLTASGLEWAWTTNHAGNWHPLTWITLMFDRQLYGPGPFGFHFSNVLWHVAASVLLFAVLAQTTRAVGRSAFVAGLFALHPQRVESVAWIAERKDVLSAFLWMLTLWAYVRYARAPRFGRYWPVLLCFALGLMAKPMLVTLPLALLLLDYWPLRRFRFAPARGAHEEKTEAFRTSPPRRLLVEKMPLLLLSVASSVLTLIAQSRGGAVASVEHVSLAGRIAHAAVAYVRYLGKMCWPSDLAVLYPHPGAALPAWQVVGAILLLLAGCALVWRGRSHGYLLTGWLWFLVALIPVIGLVQVGSAAIADRYTYLPHVGLYMMVAWGVPELAERLSPARARGASGKSSSLFRALPAIAVLVLAGCAAASWVQAGVWKDSQRLWEHAVGATRNNYLAHANLAKVHYDHKRLEEAERHYREALRIKPDEPGFWSNLGIVLADRGSLEEAASSHDRALSLDPNLPEAYRNRALVFVRQGKLEAARGDFERALQLRPDDPDVRFNLALTLVQLGRREDAETQLREVLARRPDYARARALLEQLGRSQAGAGNSP